MQVTGLDSLATVTAIPSTSASEDRSHVGPAGARAYDSEDIFREDGVYCVGVGEKVGARWPT